jgi:ribosomal protein S18 acetylase RimI-like enzyme
MEPRIRPLADDDLDALHAGFLAAFADYHVPMQLSREAFSRMLSTRGWSAPHSRAAVDGDAVVGFWLTGTDAGDGGPPVACDLITGVAPEHRRRRLADRLWHDLEPGLRDAGYATCQLEVIRDNTPAITLYRRLGFAVSRALDCYAVPATSLDAVATPAGVTLAAEAVPPWPTLRAWWEWMPSWPGRPGTVERAGEDAVTVVARADFAPVGHITVVRGASNVAQLAVAPAWRRRGVGRALLAAGAALLPAGTALRYLNVPATDEATAALLRAVGGAFTVGQYEMVRSL